MTKTPYRYPGSKNKMLPILMEHLNPLLDKSTDFIDVFVGGGSVLLEVAEKYPNIQLHANDKDYWVYSFWNVVSSSDSKKLEELLSLVETKPTLELFYKLREEPPNSEIEAAYRSIFFNRTTFSGIAYSGPIGGKEQKSKYTVDCRYNVKKLKDKITKCRSLLKDRTNIYNKDFSELEILNKSNYPAYCDPPYVLKGDALYIEKMSSLNHEELANILNKRDNWVLSYDDCDLVKTLYKDNVIVDLAARYCINGKKNTWENKNELIILPERRSNFSKISPAVGDRINDI